MKCLKCGAPDNIEEALYCTNCGFELDGNYCTNANCENNEDEPLSCSQDDCYCNICGSEATFFRDGIIKPKKYED